MRLNKAIAATGFCSRRKADEYIFSGCVFVNNIIETNPARHIRFERDVISVDGKTLEKPHKFTCILLHKPVHVVCTLNDPQGRPTIIDILPKKYKQIRLYPVGRLDYFSEGLLLLTNDGQLAQRLMHPRYHQPKTYEVLVRGNVSEKKLMTIRNGMHLTDGDDVDPLEVEATALPSGNTQLRMVLCQGLNRQIRRMCRDLGLIILRLRRIAQGILRLGDLPYGSVRPLTPMEYLDLRKSVNLSH
ncbi:MAG: rRNA pseudouridine synthase [Desulfovibrio sp.]|nr:rRNA pseudouridine synthase [Desulfovibrio sp.]